MKRLKRWGFGLILLFGVLAVLLWRSHAWLAISERSGGKVLVVEGWMDELQLEQAAALFKEGGYALAYTTGTVRPFAYYLVPGAQLRLGPAKPAFRSVEVSVAGLPACTALVVMNGDTVLRAPTGDRITNHGIDLREPASSIVIACDPMYPQPGPPSVFIHSLRLDGKNAHELQAWISVLNPDSSLLPGTPSYADHAAAILALHGVPSDRITAVPAGGDPVSRSWANAATLGHHLGGQGIMALDVVTLGVHARRSRALYREALGEGVAVGVVSLPDPDCPADGWWKSQKGWYTLLKEIAGSQEAAVVDATR
ncbi:MAG: hypothetical protein IPJ76_17610 [Flavobacteriales bacterium]|nr:MAG: hypothetical protein IPJ76_17610 [Flavobacteriales bacterium]